MFVLLLSLALAPAGAQPPLASSEADWLQLVEEAKARESAKEWQAAGELYRTALSRAASSEIDELGRLDVLEALGDLLFRHLAQHLDAVPLYEQAIEIRRARSETTGRRARATWAALRSIYESARSWSKAAALAAETVENLEAEEGEDSPHLVHHLTHLAWLVEQADPEDPEAETLIQRAVTLAVEGNLETQYDAYAAAGRHYLRQDRPFEAVALFADALELHRSASTPEAGDMAAVSRSLAEAYARSDQPELAEATLVRALAEEEERLGSDHPDLVPTLYELGKLLASVGRHEEARLHLARAMTLADAAWGRGSASWVRHELRQVDLALGRVPAADEVPVTDHRCCRAGLSPEVEALRARGEIDRAVELARAEVASRIAQEGADSLAVASALDELGSLLWAIDAAGSIEAHERELEILERRLAADDPRVGRVAGSIGTLYSTMDRHEEAEAWRQVEVDRLAVSSAGSAVLADALEDLGHTRMRLGKPAAAAGDFALAAELWQALSGEAAPQYRKARRWHAVALGKAGRFGEAEAILVEQLAALEERTTSSEEDWLALERVLGDLTRLYRSIGRKAEAQLMEERRNALFRNRD